MKRKRADDHKEKKHDKNKVDKEGKMLDTNDRKNLSVDESPLHKSTESKKDIENLETDNTTKEIVCGVCRTFIGEKSEFADGYNENRCVMCQMILCLKCESSFWLQDQKVIRCIQCKPRKDDVITKIPLSKRRRPYFNSADDIVYFLYVEELNGVRTRQKRMVVRSPPRQDDENNESSVIGKEDNNDSSVHDKSITVGNGNSSTDFNHGDRNDSNDDDEEEEEEVQGSDNDENDDTEYNRLHDKLWNIEERILDAENFPENETPESLAKLKAKKDELEKRMQDMNNEL